METPAHSSPRPEPTPADASPDDLGGREAAQLRRYAASSALPDERAQADAIVLTAWLTPQQRAAYASHLRSGGDLDAFVEVLAQERRVVLEEGAEEVPGELEAAAQAERSARQTPLRWAEGAALVLTAGFLAALITVAVQAGREVLSDPLPAAAMLGATLLCLIGAGVLGAVAARRRDRALLDWAAARGGQLGRGLPLVRPLQTAGIGPRLLTAVLPPVLIGAGILLATVGAGMLVYLLLVREAPGLVVISLVLLAAGAAAFVAAMVWSAIRTRRADLAARRELAVEWFEPGEA